MKHHNLKCHPIHFNPILDGGKTYEIRKNDRDYKTGDSFTLHEYYYDHGPCYTGRKLSGVVGHVSDYCQWPGHVVFSLLKLGLLIIETEENKDEPV